MALTFPLTPPQTGVAEQSFEILRVDLLSGDGAGRLGGVTRGFPLWSWEFTLSTGMGEDRADLWTAFLDALRGPQRTFYARDPSRPFPKSRPTGFGGLVRAGTATPFAGAATSWSVNGTRDVLTLNGLPAGLVLSLRDYVGFEWTTTGQPRRALARLVEAGVANGSGVAAVTIEPALPTLVPAGAVATLATPSCLMRIDPRRTNRGKMNRRRAPAATVAAIQTLEP